MQQVNGLIIEEEEKKAADSSDSEDEGGERSPVHQPIDIAGMFPQNRDSEELEGLERASDCSFDLRDLQELKPKSVNWSQIEESVKDGATRGRTIKRKNN